MCDVPNCPDPSTYRVIFRLWPKGYDPAKCGPAEVSGLTVCAHHARLEMFDGFFMDKARNQPAADLVEAFRASGKAQPDFENPDILFDLLEPLQ
jgi:hypothetical protein